MNKKKSKNGNATWVGAKKEMAEPRMAKSARIAELKLDATRNPEQPITTMPGIVSKIVPPSPPSQPGKAKISVDRTDHRRNLCVENSLTEEYGDDVKLKKGSHLAVTVTAEPEM